jgi:two-component system sensor histidine kinase/response regulator
MNKKILIVDDEQNIRETISEYLLHKNYIVKTAINGEEALELLKSWSPDIIISDIMMPEMDGNELFGFVRENKTLNQIPFVFLTAKSEQDTMRNSMINGADDFLTKPFKFDELLQVIKIRIDRYEKTKRVYDYYNIEKNKQFTHEINTPLFGILGAIELLIENKAPLKDHEIENFYKLIRISGERLNRTFHNLMLSEKLKNDDLKFSKDSQSEILNTFLIVIKKYQKLNKNQKERLEFDIDDSNIKISTAFLEFVLYELIDNALKFSPQKEKVIVSGKKHNEKYYQILINDFGTGLTDEEIKNIGALKQFQREIREQQGMGLGLFLSKNIIEKSDGIFKIHSKANKGTEISILLPLA